MEPALLPDERTDLDYKLAGRIRNCPISKPEIGQSASQKLANQQAVFRSGCDLVCDWLPAYEMRPICRYKSGALNSMIESLNVASVLHI